MKLIPITGSVTYVADLYLPMRRMPRELSPVETLLQGFFHYSLGRAYPEVHFREAKTGEEIVVKNLYVSGALNEHIAVGKTGTFLITRELHRRGILGFRDGARHTIDESVGNVRLALGHVMVAAAGVLLPTLLAIVAGTSMIPLIALGLIWFLWVCFTRFRFWPKQARKMLKAHGFRMTNRRVI